MAYLFNHRSEVTISAEAADEERLLEGLLELDADGYALQGQEALVHGPFAALESLQDGLRNQGWDVREWGHHWAALTTVSIADADMAKQCLKLLDALDGLDDVRSINANIELSDDLDLNC